MGEIICPKIIIRNLIGYRELLEGPEEDKVISAKKSAESFPKDWKHDGNVGITRTGLVVGLFKMSVELQMAVGVVVELGVLRGIQLKDHVGVIGEDVVLVVTVM